MKFDSKYLKFEFAYNKPKTSVYNVLAKDGNIKLGIIKWYAHWRQYGFFPESETVFEKTCMGDITRFLIGLNQGQRQHKELQIIDTQKKVEVEP